MGSEWTWSDWVKREPGVWLPTRVRERNFGVGPDATVFTAEYVFDKVDLTRRFADADFRPDIPNGYKVHDERRGLNLIYIKGGQFLRPEPPDALAAIDGPGGQPLPAVAAAYPGGPSTAAEAKPIASASVVGGEGAAPPTGRSSRSWVVAAVAAVAAAAGAASGGLWMAHRGRRGARAA